jgi:hypothetical protein
VLRFDHVIVASGDVEATAKSLRSAHGLTSLPGGRHRGHGTGNHIVPLGHDYIEIMGVVDQDEARTSQLGRWVQAQSDGGDSLGALCLRVADIGEVCGRLGLEPLPMSRVRADGSLLSWDLAGLDQALEEPPLPFFISWHGPAELHPGRMEAEHDVSPQGISWVHLAGDPDRLAAWLGPHDLDIRIDEGPPGVRAVGIATAKGEIVLEGDLGLS